MMQPILSGFATVSLALALVFAGGLSPADARATDTPPNIVFILSDDQGNSDVGFNGAKFFETPNIDRLAREGMIFSHAYSGGPNCAPTRACLISGTYTPRHRIYTPGGLAKGDPRRMRLLVPTRPSDLKVLSRTERAAWRDTFESRVALDPEVISIAEVLNRAGYTTARLGKWHLGDDTQGFDVSSSDGVSCPQGSHYNDPTVAEKLTDAAVRFIGENRERPFFLYLAHWDVHTPLVADEKVVAKYEKKLAGWSGDERNYHPTYAAMVEAVDTSVGRVLEALDQHQLAEQTLVIFSSDNGGVGSISFNAPLRAGKGSLYEGGVRVPTAARWPGVIRAGSVCATPITSVDFLPTFTDLAGATLPEDQPVDGQSIVPLFKGEKALGERAIFWHYPLYLSGAGRRNYVPYEGGRPGEGAGWRTTPAGAIRQGDWKLIEFFEQGNIELYNVVEDVGEQRNVAGDHPRKVRDLREKLAAWRKSTGAVEPSEANPLFARQ